MSIMYIYIEYPSPIDQCHFITLVNCQVDVLNLLPSPPKSNRIQTAIADLQVNRSSEVEKNIM